MFEEKYPYIVAFVNTIGWMELGKVGNGGFLRIMGGEGLIWDDEEAESIEEALQSAEDYLKNDFGMEYGIVLEI